MTRATVKKYNYIVTIDGVETYVSRNAMIDYKATIANLKSKGATIVKFEFLGCSYENEKTYTYYQH